MEPPNDDRGVTKNRRRSSVKRVTQACDRCRWRKVRCSGQQPCVQCCRGNAVCHFADFEPRISVSTRLLRHLQSELASAQQSSHENVNVDVTNAPDRTSGAPARSGIPLAEPYSMDHLMASSAGIAEPGSYIEAEAIHRGFDDWDLQTAPAAKEVISATPPTSVSSLDSDDETFSHNPLVSNKSHVEWEAGDLRQQWYLGPSSSWSFARQMTEHLQRVFLPDTTLNVPINLDGTAYPITLDPNSLRAANEPLGLDLPSLDYAIYLFNTVEYHLNQVFRFIDGNEFHKRLRSFYEDGCSNTSSPFSYAGIMLVFAFGEAFLSQNDRTVEPSPVKGWTYACRAFAALPALHLSAQDNLLAIEVFCIAALYLQSLDMRVSAFEFAGRALKLCYVVGIHRSPFFQDPDAKTNTRESDLWWTVYMLDQHLSASMGAPASVHDYDMTAALPPAQIPDPRAAALSIHMQLSRILARLTRTVYSVQLPFRASFLTDAQDALDQLERTAQQMSGEVSKSPSLSSHLRLYHCHCIVLTTRPVLMAILLRYEREKSRPLHSWPPSLSNSVTGLLRACIDAALHIVYVLVGLRRESRLETFLPFHLEQLFSSAFILRIVSRLSLDDRNLLQALEAADSLVETMIARGNGVARMKQGELKNLEALLAAIDVGSLRPLHETQHHSTIPVIQGPVAYEQLAAEIENSSSAGTLDLPDVFNMQDMTGQIDYDSFEPRSPHL